MALLFLLVVTGISKVESTKNTKKNYRGKITHNKRLKRDCQRVAFPVPLSRVVSVVVFEFCVNAL
ncbi:TPA: hypothetical protein ACGF6R_003679, partial [Vibrio cholerae]